MANKEHLDLIKQGVEVWNKWRGENTGEIPDISRANLIVADLEGADLSKADLIEANLSGADLRTPHVTVDQLAEAKSLYKAKLLPKTETELREKYPERYKELIKKPVEPDNETK